MEFNALLASLENKRSNKLYSFRLGLVIKTDKKEGFLVERVSVAD